MIILNLTPEETNLIIESLLQLPAKMSMNLILKISEEGKRQVGQENNNNQNSED